MEREKSTMRAVNIIITIITAPIWIIAALAMIIVFPVFWMSKLLMTKKVR